MYAFLNNLLSDKKGGEIFTVFGAWHFFYIALTIFTVAVVLFLLKNKTDELRKRTIKSFIYIAFSLYVLDFFLMPFAYGEIDIEKLPFHACTMMCVLSFLSYHNRFLEKYRLSFAMMGFISNIIYLSYPAGLMWQEVQPISYRVIQTLLFHSIMTIYGLLTLIYEYDKFDIKKSYRDLGVILFMVAWALLGNYTYSGSAGEYSRYFNWFFVVQDPFFALPESIAPFVTPFLNTIVFFATEIVIYIVIMGVQRRNKKCLSSTL